MKKSVREMEFFVYKLLRILMYYTSDSDMATLGQEDLPKGFDTLPALGVEISKEWSTGLIFEK